METGVWLPIEQAPKDGTEIICSWAGNDTWQVLCWKHNDRINKDPRGWAYSEPHGWRKLNASYFGDVCEWDDYDLAEDGAGPDYFLLIPPVPAKKVTG